MNADTIQATYDQLTVISAVERLANAIEFPDTRDAEIAFELSRGEVEQAKQTPTPDWLEAHGLSPQAARLFARTLRQPGRSGTITVLRTRLGKAVTMRLVGILVSTDSLGWLAPPIYACSTPLVGPMKPTG